MLNKKVIILMGPPGSGKGTQAKLLCDKFGLEYIGSGDLLRARKKKNDFNGKQIAVWIDSGKRVPTPVIFYLWMQKFDEFKKRENHIKGFVVDGSPRTLREAEMLEEALGWYGWAKNKKALYVKLSSQESVWRLTKRRMCQKCGRIIPYVGDFKDLKKCDKCNGSLVARPDDSIKGVKERLKWFKTDVVPAINFYKKRKELITINGKQSIEYVFKDILKAAK